MTPFNPIAIFTAFASIYSLFGLLVVIHEFSIIKEEEDRPFLTYLAVFFLWPVVFWS